MTIVGYDTNGLYFYDSRLETDENDSEVGNITMSEKSFMQLWDNGLPIFNNVYIVSSI